MIICHKKNFEILVSYDTEDIFNFSPPIQND
jgi:hypothetical protein